MRNFLIAFVLSEIYYLSGFSNFWFTIVLLYSVYWFINFLKLKNEALAKKTFFFAWPLVLLFGVFLFFPSVFVWSTVLEQIYLICGFIIFYFLIRFYKKSCIYIDFFRFFSPLIILPFSFLFFRSNLFSDFFLKQLLLFISLFFLFESYRQIFVNKKTNILITLVPVTILLEFAWILNFLPVNFLSIGAVWLIIFVLVNELWILNAENQFSLRYYLPEMIFALVLMVLILVSSSWRIV